ncbi:MAG: aminotransferase class IV [Leucobacter sp.]
MTAQATALLVADSFRVRVRGGIAEVRGARLHLDRFTRSVRARMQRSSELSRFLDEAVERITQFGDSFPRLELRGPREDTLAPQLALSLRPLPPLGTSLTMRSAGWLDLPTPQQKGPNIARFSDLNREIGAEALLQDSEGMVLEGSTTAIVWWRDGELFRVADSARVPSVTEHLIVEAARTLGIVVRTERVSPAELLDCEVWAVNALHGIRPVSTLDGTAMPVPDRARLSDFDNALDKAWSPL